MIKALKSYISNKMGPRGGFICFEDGISQKYIKKNQLKIYGYDIRNDIPVTVHITGKDIDDMCVGVRKISKNCKLYKDAFEKLDTELHIMRDSVIHLAIKSGFSLVSNPEAFVVVCYKGDRYLGYIHFLNTKLEK